MKGILKSIKRVEYKTSKGTKFSKVEFTCDVKMNEQGDVKTLKGSYGDEFARKYFTYCGILTKDLIGKEVEVTVAKKSFEAEGEMRIFNYIKYLNVLDAEGKAIYLPKEDKEDTLDY
jgi:hypothetical protein